MDLSQFTNRVKSLDGFVSSDTGSEQIRFLCEEELYSAIAEPVPATRIMPEWYVDLAPDTGDEGVNTSTVKKCAPFFDALTRGWIFRTPADVHFSVEGGEVSTEWSIDRNLISPHSLEQVGEKFPYQQPLLKWNNLWAIDAPDGYSALFMPPLNRFEELFEPFAGIVDIDNYFNFINFPFRWTGGDHEGVIPRGTPIVQMIPFKRGSFLTEGTIDSFSGEELTAHHQDRHRVNAEGSVYRDKWWTPKEGSYIAETFKNEE